MIKKNQGVRVGDKQQTEYSQAPATIPSLAEAFALFEFDFICQYISFHMNFTGIFFM